MTSTDRQQQYGRPVAEVVTASVLLGFGLFYGYRAVEEGVGTPSDTGPGFFPLLVAVVLTGASAVVLVNRRSDTPADLGRAETSDEQTPSNELPGDDEGGPVDEATSWRRIAGVLLASLAVPLMADTTGFVVTLSAVVVVIAKIMGMPGLLKPALLGVAFGATAWFVFVYWLFVPLPAGSLGLV